MINSNTRREIQREQKLSLEGTLYSQLPRAKWLDLFWKHAFASVLNVFSTGLILGENRGVKCIQCVMVRSI